MTAQAIKELRVRLGLTQTELGSQLGRSKQAISDWERGKVRPDALAVKIMEGMK